MTTFSKADARVLVVDDERSIVRMLTRGLESAGYSQVTGVTDSTQALEHIASSAPDLIVLDLNMPGVDGFQLLAEINARLPEDTFLPVLVFSGLQDQESKEKAFQAGAKDYLTKPVELAEFLLHVDSLLETRSMSQRLLETRGAMERVIGDQAEELQRTDAERQQAAEELSETEFKFHAVAASPGTRPRSSWPTPTFWWRSSTPTIAAR
jgi:putative two-component system response regulator